MLILVQIEITYVFQMKLSSRITRMAEKMTTMPECEMLNTLVMLLVLIIVSRYFGLWSHVTKSKVRIRF